MSGGGGRTLSRRFCFQDESHMASAADQLASSISLSKFSKATELKKRLWFTLGALIVFRCSAMCRFPASIRPSSTCSPADCRAACSISSTTSPAARSTACRSSRSA
jgi:hypothetical protein